MLDPSTDKTNVSTPFDLDFHHVGVIVGNIESSLQHFTILFGKERISKIYHVSSQKVNVCFIKTGEGSHIELVEPLGNDSGVARLLKKRVSYYHMAYKVKDIQDSIKRLETLNYKSLNLFNSEAFDGKLCAFLFSPEGLLMELIEK